MGYLSENILAVDTDMDVHERLTATWAKYGVGAIRVSTMQKAVERLARDDGFFLIVINEDTVPNYMSSLSLMRDVTSSPVFVLTSGYTIEKRVRAYKLGADAYEPFNKSADEYIVSVLELLNLKKRWSERSINPLPVLVSNGIMLSPGRRMVFVEDTEISLTKKEFDILHYLMEKNGAVAGHTQILKKIWGDHYGGDDADVLWQTVDRLRRKLSKASPERTYIKAEYGIGYRFLI
ncbi:MAG: response regulator transcription factor [Oscillospiraceae bacterium]|nr:response regulator transcription factor [Oscillospiraceae bacterium]